MLESSHLCFHSSVLGFTSQRVLPLLTVASASHSPSVLGMDLVTLVDRGGEEHSFGITAVEAGFPQRFRDLLNQCLVLCKVCGISPGYAWVGFGFCRWLVDPAC